MNNIPEDNTLRRHCLTELNAKQKATFDSMIADALRQPATATSIEEPLFSIPVLFGLVGFLFVIGLFFI